MKGLFGRAAADRPEDSKKSFFFVKEEKAEQILGRGIACAVEREVRGDTKYFLLTSTDVKNEQEQSRVFAKRCFCRPWPLDRRKRKKEVEVRNYPKHEDLKFSFIPIDYEPEKPFKLIPEKNIKKQKEKCRSFVITKDSFTTVYWEYNSDAQRYQLCSSSKDTDLEEPNAAGSPVLWTDPQQNQSYVVGVIRRQSPKGIFFPEMFSKDSLQLTEGTKPSNNAQPGPNLPDPTYSLRSPDSTQPGPKALHPAQPDPRTLDPAQPCLKPPDVTQPSPKAPKAAKRDPKLPYPAQPGPKSLDPAQPGPNPPDPTQSIPKAPEAAKPGPKPPYPAQPGPKSLDPAQPGTNPQNPAQSIPKVPEDDKPNPKPPDPAQPSPKPPNLAQPGPKPPQSAQPGSELLDPTQSGPKPPDPTQAGPTQTDNTDNVIVNFKVPKSVVGLLFFMVFILGVLAMEWWFPWLTGRAVKL